LKCESTTNLLGHIAVTPCRHDPIADLLAAPADSFERKHNTQVKEMKRLVLVYIKALQAMLNNTGTVDGEDSVPIPLDAKVICSGGGFPKVIGTTPPSQWTKKELEQALRLYLSHQYCM